MTPPPFLYQYITLDICDTLVIGRKVLKEVHVVKLETELSG